MMHRVRRVRRFCRRDAGFTLTELVIAMLVVGVLASIALPSFLGSRNNSYDKEAQASIQAILRAANLVYQSQGDFSDGSSAGCGTDAGSATSLAADLQRLEPGVDVVGGSVSSSNSRVVSVDARPTFNSNGEKLGCQAFYATVFSSSGTCFVARLTFEGKFLLASSVSPIRVASQLNTQNVAVTTWSALAANGVAYAQIRSRSSGADADNTQTLALIQSNCKAQTQSTGSATTAAYYADPGNFYLSWRDTTTNPADPPPPTCAQGGPCVLGETGPGGGTVFYVSAENFTSTGSDCGTSCKYLEAATSDQSTSIVWSTTAAFCFPLNSDTGTSNCQLNSIYPGVTAVQAASRTAAESIGRGMANTNQIYARLTTAGGAATNTYAAGLAFEYTNNGKSDWHLPSKDEWTQLYNQRATVGNFAVSLYWVSTEGGNNVASSQTALSIFLNDGGGGQGEAVKSGNMRVRAARAFGPTG